MLNGVDTWLQGVSDMKKKIGTLIEENTMRLAKRKAAEEGRSLSDVIQDALVEYLRKQAATPKERKMAFRLFCEQPMKIPSEQLRYVLEEDMWDL
jgi:hypothetical protein